MISIDTMLAGLTNGEFFLEYMPTVSLADGRCSGAEALIRWRRATGIVQPNDFIPLAENTFMSGLITNWVFDTVAAEMGDWLRTNPNAHIAINAPPAILGRGSMMYAAQKSGLMEFAPQIILEITERGMPDSLGIDTVNLARQMLGVQIALDDVTLAGCANLAIFLRANIDIIKLDKSLIAQINPQCPYPDWLKGITALLRSSPIVVYAEGVETEQQWIALREAEIHEGQGFYFSRPIPAALFIAYHRDARHSLPNQPLQQTGGA
jgi:sensor c-di-GMP phosphodiesterase-like protein